MSAQFLYGALPYVAAALLCAVPFCRARPAREATSGLSAPLWLGLGGLGLGHLVPVLFPGTFAGLTSSLPAAIALEAAGLTCALSVGLGLVQLLTGRAAGRAGSRGASPALLMVLLATASGIAVALTHRFASRWGAAVVTPYLRSLLAFSPDPTRVALLPGWVRAHVVLGLVSGAAVAFSPLAATLAWRLRDAVTRQLRAWTLPAPTGSTPEPTAPGGQR